MQFQDEQSETYRFNDRDYQPFKSPLRGRLGKVDILAIGYRVGASEITLLLEDPDGELTTTSFTKIDPNFRLLGDGETEVRKQTTKAKAA